jgi:hypothetical protein
MIALAAACSLVAAIATRLLKSENPEERISRAETSQAWNSEHGADHREPDTSAGFD